MPITDQINQIIDIRQSRLGSINEKLERLEALSSELVNYERLRDSIVDHQGKLKEDSPFAPMLLSHPEMVKRIFEAATPTLKSSIATYSAELKRLHHIYSRNSISVLVFGFAGAGKSTLIQRITGLDNNVILASDDRSEGIHCTGASSFVYNAPEFEARVYFYTADELLKIFNKNFMTLQKKYCGPNNLCQLNSFDEIQNFVPTDYYLPNGPEVASLNLYTAHFQLIRSLTSETYPDGSAMHMSSDKNGLRYLKLTDPSLVQQYVAQYNGKSGDELIEYFNFIAVKRVDIFTPFPNAENVGKIVLMDNVGLGDPTNDQSTQDTMYESIAANSDAVIFLYSPDAGPGFVSDQKEIMELVRNLRTKDFTTGEERMDKNQLYMLVNKVETSKINNSANCEAFRRWFNSQDKVHGGGRDETCLIVKAIDPEECNNALIKVLDQMIQHLFDIDRRMEDKAATTETAFATELQNFLRKVGLVTLATDGQNRIINFDKRFQQLYRNHVRKDLIKMLEEARDRSSEISSDLHKQLMTRCTSEKATEKIDEIDEVIDHQLDIQPHAIDAYLNTAAYLRHAVPNDFRKVDTDLQRKIEERKARPFETLFTIGRLSKLLKMDKRQTDKTTAMVDWARKFTQLFLDEENYPLLHKLFSDLLAFHQNVDGFLLPKIIKHLDTFQENAPATTIPTGKEKKIIRYYLNTNLIDSFEEIRKDLTNFVHAPNEAVYFALDEFAYGLIFSEEVANEARKLYANFYEVIWEEEVEKEEQQNHAFEEWTKQKRKLSEIKDYFENV